MGPPPSSIHWSSWLVVVFPHGQAYFAATPIGTVPDISVLFTPQKGRDRTGSIKAGSSPQTPRVIKAETPVKCELFSGAQGSSTPASGRFKFIKQEGDHEGGAKADYGGNKEESENEEEDEGGENEEEYEDDVIAGPAIQPTDSASSPAGDEEEEELYPENDIFGMSPVCATGLILQRPNCHPSRWHPSPNLQPFQKSARHSTALRSNGVLVHADWIPTTPASLFRLV